MVVKKKFLKIFEKFSTTKKAAQKRVEELLARRDIMTEPNRPPVQPAYMQRKEKIEYTDNVSFFEISPKRRLIASIWFLEHVLQ